MNFSEKVRAKLSEFKKDDIIITNHAKEQAIFRGIFLMKLKKIL
jgi:hypothetical protein